MCVCAKFAWFFLNSCFKSVCQRLGSCAYWHCFSTNMYLQKSPSNFHPSAPKLIPMALIMEISFILPKKNKKVLGFYATLQFFPKEKIVKWYIKANCNPQYSHLQLLGMSRLSESLWYGSSGLSEASAPQELLVNCHAKNQFKCKICMNIEFTLQILLSWVE